MAEIPFEVDNLSNSHKTREERANQEAKKKNLEKVVEGSVRLEKKTLGKKFAETFLKEDVQTVKKSIWYDIIIPKAKDMLYTCITDGISMMLFGETKGKNINRIGGNSYVSYSSYYNSNTGNNNRTISDRDRAIHNFSGCIFDTRGDAERVLSELFDLTVDYGQASVADFYDLAGIERKYTDDNWGWKDLRDASVSRCRDGYVINFPKVIQLGR